jgi:alpha-amylase/alpha-mannosidase (GH57 family)
MSERYVVLHGHFYQPPRENPWIEEIEVQDSAAPYHDWNERIHAECYGPNSASRVVAGAGGIIDIHNNYRKLSFNFGPTLMSWLEARAPSTYRRILEADREGQGALAQAYNHAILPLCNRRDKRTQVRWGMRDFGHRFGRRPTGLWLPECAVDLESLEVLVDEGIAFTILSPHSCARWRAPGAATWITSGVDPRRAYRVALPSGRHIAVFFYDGASAQKIAFGDAVHDRDALIGQLSAAFDPDPARRGPQLVNVATDGETFGHHRSFGDMVLAAAFERIERERLFELTTYAAWLERFPPDHEAEIVSPSSWSCAHGVDRWRRDCGCTTPAPAGWHQRWRGPLREVIDELRDSFALLFEREAAPLLADPWRARDGYIAVVLDRSPPNVDRFLDHEARRRLEPSERTRVLKLLEMQRHSLLMQTSCGWFFDELSRPEPVQVLRYAMRAVQLARETGGEDLEPLLARRLAAAPSNVHRDGAEVLDRLVRPGVTSLGRVIAHHAISSLFQEYPRHGRLYSYRFDVREYVRRSRGPAQLAVGQVRIESEITRETMDASFGLLHFGGHDFHCAVGGPREPGDHAELSRDLLSCFDEGSLIDVVHAIDRHFGGRAYDLGDLFLDERQRIVGILLDDLLARWRDRWERLFDQNRGFLRFLSAQQMPAPGLLRVAAEQAMSSRMGERIRELTWGAMTWSALRQELRLLHDDANRLGISLDLTTARQVLEARIVEAVERLASGKLGAREAAQAIGGYLDVARELAVRVEVWQAQNCLWAALREATPPAWEEDDREAVERLLRTLGFDPGVVRPVDARGAAAASAR